MRESEKFDVDNRTLRIEKLKIRIEMRQFLRFRGKPKPITISKRAGKYYVSILIDTDEYDPKDVDRQPSVGIDFGIKSLAILSNGESFPASQPLKNEMHKLKKLNRKLSQKVTGSNRRARAKLKFRVCTQE
jgi:putative transposase